MVNMKDVVMAFVMIMMLSGMPASVQAQTETGLVGEWHFDGDAKDSSGNGNDGTIYGASFVEGKFGKALSFNGVNDYVDCGNDASLNFGTSTFTIETWIRTNDVVTTDWKGIVGRWDGSNGYWLQYLPSSDQWAFGWHAYNYLNPTQKVGDGNWHHIIGKRTGLSSAELYIDGVFIGSHTNLPIISSDTTDILSIGRLSSGLGRYFNGIIDEVRIYNRALTNEEIKEHYEQGPTVLYLTKTASPQSIKQGQTTTITLTVKNTGSTEISDIEISDVITKDLTLIDGETTKTYASLSPKDSRQFQYSVQINEAGTFNLGQATASYADNMGNYQTIKSKPASIEVIPSLVTDSKQTPSRKSNNNAQSASVNLHGEKTDVELGENVLLKLSAVNIIGNPAMHVQVIIIPPSGWSVTSSEFAKSGAGQYSTTYDLESGGGKDIEVRIVPNQVGEDFKVEGRIVYYFGDDVATREDHTLNLPIKVRAKSNAEMTTVVPPSDKQSTPGFAFVIGVLGIGVAMQFIKRK